MVLNHSMPVQIRQGSPSPLPINPYGSHRLKPNKLIMTYLPTFAWQTVIEIVTMLEQIDEDINEASIKIRLWQLWKQGKIEKKTVLRWDKGTGRKTTSMFRRVS